MIIISFSNTDNTPRNFLDYIDAELKAKVESCIVPYKYLSINEKTGEGKIDYLLTYSIAYSINNYQINYNLK